MATCYLREGSDYLEDATRFNTIADAKESFRRAAKDLDRYGQKHEATIHIADTMDEVVEYPDYVLSLGKRGGLVCERT